ncbi:MAG: tRNA (adenosine(37)-N6)-dimethylallyltransferase MiaA [Bacteroidetes bacterium]|nr:tRNA (adenosine(37)-N6)-dimethylallyltransferase MiaA [Bacteroidota bacterium]MBU1484642.1 tRNA (adenosine(37)-N6)-dimethylallyltransferase MiaA [Bacteroidota bacterium]MBU2046061.1 tRNA (adenosine(37)-N6)-dimethylallyltransferase MiaA [Bacteroidota bacterium]MBU2269080.1 tRNA (adenosine(37)-N6)-dimethylallyltransferase MiaA [Bacteroidota bacterium]MBU2377396.1 tRNA (adenosine(37)-N6)-dimethylallyltransferase MiaA [Bacteroidota bacterium]
MQGKQKTLIVIAGPTAIGKTALAIEIAQTYQTEIISADSRQFFKEMSIGTAKPNPQELATVPHHFINSHSIHEEVSVGTFEKQASAKIDTLFQQNDVLVMVGGSGLYINAVLYGFDEIPKADENLRNQLNQRLASEGIESLQKQLKELDPTYFNQVDIHNPQRVIRALEVCLTTGKPFSSFRKTQNKERNFNTIFIGLNTEREQLYERINLRVDLMMQDGLLDEVKSLREYQHLNALKTVGYSEIFNHINGEWTLEQAVDKIKQNSRNFAKRQLTWFKRSEDVLWFNPSNSKEILDYVETTL